eukprot:g2458.t1
MGGSLWVRTCVPFSDYVAAARKIAQAYGYKQIFLATDSSKVINAAKTDASGEFEWAFQGQIDRSMYDNSKGEFIEELVKPKLAWDPISQFKNTIDELLIDIYSASHCDAFVGTFGSAIGRMIYGLMNHRAGRVMPSVSLDGPFGAFQLLEGGNLDTLGVPKPIRAYFIQTLKKTLTEEDLKPLRQSLHDMGGDEDWAQPGYEFTEAEDGTKTTDGDAPAWGGKEGNVATLREGW